MSAVHIKGDANVVGSGNYVHYGSAAAPPDGHINAVECPQCFQRAWRHSECWNCKADVRVHYDSIESAERDAAARASSLKLITRYVMPLLIAGAACALLAVKLQAAWLSFVGLLLIAAGAVVTPIMRPKRD